MEGHGNGRFEPDGTLTQEQLITVMGRLARFLNFQLDDYALERSEDELACYSDFQNWARMGASVLTAEKNMLCTDLSAVVPGAPATREQTAATLCNILKGLRILAY